MRGLLYWRVTRRPSHCSRPLILLWGVTRAPGAPLGRWLVRFVFVEAYSTWLQQGEWDRLEQLDTAVTSSSILYEVTTMAVGSMAVWLHVGGIHVYTQHGRAAL